jgi:hypothetical protein
MKFMPNLTKIRQLNFIRGETDTVKSSVSRVEHGAAEFISPFGLSQERTFRIKEPLAVLPLRRRDCDSIKKKSITLFQWRVFIASWSRWWEKRHYELKVRPVGDCKLIFS